LSNSTASSLLRRAKSRDESAWKDLVQLYAPLVYFWCRKSQLQTADAADIAQEVFQAASERLEKFQRAETGSFRGWLRVITRNKIFDFVQRQQKQPQGPGGSSAHAVILQVPDPLNELTEEPSVDRSDHNLLSHALECLRSEMKDSTWQIFWRTTVEGHDPTDVASELRIQIANVYKAKSRTLARLRRLLVDLEANLEKNTETASGR